MPIVQENISLKPYNSFGIEVRARYFTVVNSTSEFSSVRESGVFQNNEVLVLGGGSNVLFTRNFDGLVLVNRIGGFETVRNTEDHIIVRFGAGEVWHETVLWCVEQGLGGIENLSLIPGRVGAAPIQNIGAYGCELKDVFEQLTAMDLETGATKVFTKGECAFGYRDSIFKRAAKGRYAILSVSLKLSKRPVLNLEYGAIKTTLQQMGVKRPDVKTVSEAICQIRRSKLPDPSQTGNAGSFFKNPLVSAEKVQQLKKQYGEIPVYEQPDHSFKVAAGWLIEQTGWKGRSQGSAAVHDQQALVLINKGDASGIEIRDLAFGVRQSVQNKFGIGLETEVNIL